MTTYLQQRTLFGPQIDNRPSLNLGIIVVIPCYDEAYLLLSLLCLQKCELPLCDVEVIVVVNGRESDNAEVKARNQHTYLQILEWSEKQVSTRLKFHVLYHPDLSNKHGGVGLARKIGMDEACWRFEKVGRSDGIIACFDADSRCTSNYLCALERHFLNNPASPACNIRYEHPLEGAHFEPEVYQSIVLYELHLRYYIDAQRYANFPFAFQTIGSSMAVRYGAYQRQGGMNRRKAGEDFYFLQKFIEWGNFTELNETKIIPSPRPSHRVPFGTGKAVGNLLKSQNYATYAPESFIDLKSFFALFPALYAIKEGDQVLARVPDSMRSFLAHHKFEEKWQELHHHTSTPDTFIQRFYRWFNAFMLMKYLHFARDEFYPDIPVLEAANWLLKAVDQPTYRNPKAALVHFRKWDYGEI
ncbi:MAG: hypothetical protein DHS20C18_22220 [Saprospiraceae bacterium]|nr:MAG: hypothetical protein DHS20C18_22220 [Saprospiraceae bacterium]